MVLQSVPERERGPAGRGRRSSGEPGAPVSSGPRQRRPGVPRQRCGDGFAHHHDQRTRGTGLG